MYPLRWRGRLDPNETTAKKEWASSITVHIPSTTRTKGVLYPSYRHLHSKANFTKHHHRLFRQLYKSIEFQRRTIQYTGCTYLQKYIVIYLSCMCTGHKSIYIQSEIWVFVILFLLRVRIVGKTCYLRLSICLLCREREGAPAPHTIEDIEGAVQAGAAAQCCHLQTELENMCQSCSVGPLWSNLLKSPLLPRRNPDL